MPLLWAVAEQNVQVGACEGDGCSPHGGWEVKETGEKGQDPKIMPFDITPSVT